jgi:2,3-dihydroxy-2,3-dihydro-p-cumate dehydrogenase
MSQETRRFEGQSAIVTGAAQGIGRAIADRLADEGANVMLADKNPKVARVAEEIAEKRGTRVLPFIGDVGQKAVAQLLISDANRAFGRIDILVNNAGGGGVAPLESFDEQSLLEAINNNFWTAFRCAQAAIPVMRGQKYGRIVNVTSNASFGGLGDHVVANAAKGGVHGMSSGLAVDLATTGITINTVAPAVTLIESTAEKLKLPEPPAGLLRAIARIPMGRPAYVEEVAAAVAFFASREASFVSGQILRLNGGAA